MIEAFYILGCVIIVLIYKFHQNTKKVVACKQYLHLTIKPINPDDNDDKERIFEFDHIQHLCKSIELTHSPSVGEHIFVNGDVYEVERVVHEEAGSIVLCATLRLRVTRIHEEIDILKSMGWDDDFPRTYSL